MAKVTTGFDRSISRAIQILPTLFNLISAYRSKCSHGATDSPHRRSHRRCATRLGSQGWHTCPSLQQSGPDHPTRWGAIPKPPVAIRRPCRDECMCLRRRGVALRSTRRFPGNTAGPSASLANLKPDRSSTATCVRYRHWPRQRPAHLVRHLGTRTPFMSRVVLCMSIKSLAASRLTDGRSAAKGKQRKQHEASARQEPTRERVESADALRRPAAAGSAALLAPGLGTAASCV